MNRKRFVTAALFFAIISGMSLSGCNPAGTVVGKVGNDVIKAGDIDIYVNSMLLQNGKTLSDLSASDITDINKSALEMAVDYKIIMAKGAEKKFNPLSAADQKQISDTVGQYVQQLDAQMKAVGLTQADLTRLLSEDKVAQLVMTDATKDVTVTDADAKAEYDKLLPTQQQSYSQDAANFENDQANGVVIVFRPSGYRYIKHILIAIPQDVETQISTARTGGDTANADKLRDAALLKLKPKADDVLAKVTNGGDFDSLMAQYGEDPGMKQAPASKTGYMVGSSTSFVSEFKDAALKLAKVGDTTGLVATDYGYHIIKWVGDVPVGPVPMDEVKASLQDEALQSKKSDAWDKLLAQWKTEQKVEQHPEKIPVKRPPSSVLPTA